MVKIPTSMRPGVFTQVDVYGGGAAASSSGIAVVAQGGPGDTPGAVVKLAGAITTELTGGTVLFALTNALLGAGVRPVYAVPAGGDYSAAFATCEALPVTAVVCDENAQNLADHVAHCGETAKERIGFIGISDAALACETAAALNHPHVVITCDGGTKAGLAAAGLAALASRKEAMQSFSSAEIPFEEPFDGTLTQAQVEELLGAGVTPFEDSYGQVQCIRAVTTKTQTNGILDRTFSDLSTVLAVQDVITSIRSAVKLRLRGLRNNPITRESIASQIVVELQAKRSLGIIDSFDPPRVEPHPQDAGICVATIAVRVAPEIQQIVISAQFVV